MTVAKAISDVLSEYMDQCARYKKEETAENNATHGDLIVLQFDCGDLDLFRNTLKYNREKIENRVHMMLMAEGINYAVSFDELFFTPGADSTVTARVQFRVL